MSVKFAKRIASQLLGRGENAIRINGSIDDVKKAITRDDVRRLIKDGVIVAVKPRSELHKKRVVERGKRGPGRRRGSAKARMGRRWEKKVRSQRTLLKQLKKMGKVNRATFGRYYLLIKGNAFPDKRSLLLHLSDEGIRVSDEEMRKINEYAKSLHA